MICLSVRLTLGSRQTDVVWWLYGHDVSEQKQVVIKHRIETISEYEPEFIAIGEAGFTGYLIFGFPKKNLYVLESAYIGNATYVFEDDWEKLSKLTKAEILSDNLHRERVIHRAEWKYKIRKILK